MESTGDQIIGGKAVGGEGEEFISRNPSTGAALLELREASQRQIDSAVAAAREAFEPWQDTPLAEREALLRRFAALVKERADELARLISDEAGKPRWESATEVASVAGKIDLTIQALHERRAEASFELSGSTARVSYRPLGVLAVLGPFNFPMHLPNGHIVPALLAGNAVVFKPSEATPACGEAMLRLWLEAGAPAGLVNLVQGGRRVGEALSRQEGIDGLLFTGGAHAGLALGRAFAEHPEKMLALEMGGNNPLVVHALADVEAAAFATVQSAYLTAGQRCTCARRLIVTEAAPPQFLPALIELIGRIRVGPPDADPTPFYGPLISPQNAQRVLDAQHELISRGAKPLVELKRLDAGESFLSPGLIDVTVPRSGRRQTHALTPGASRVLGTGPAAPDPWHDVEIFGPLLQVIRVSDLDKAIAEANNTRYGLAAGILTDDRAAWERFRQRIRAGIVNWNQQLTGASGRLPFGGVGLSGNFRPSGYFAIDYCNWAVGSLENEMLKKPANVTGIA